MKRALERRLIIGIFIITILCLILLAIFVRKSPGGLAISEDLGKVIKWKHMPVSYSFDNKTACTDYEANRIVDGFNRLQNESNGSISFIEIENSSDILVVCSKEFKGSDKIGYYTSGEAQYWANGDEITHAEIYFYNIAKGSYSGGCTIYPNIEIHEILHSIGFGHYDGRYDIMNPSPTYCPSKINARIITEISKAYG